MFLHYTPMRMHRIGWQVTWESDSRRPHHSGPQRPDGRRPKKAAKVQQTTPHRRHHANHAQLRLCVHFSVATESSTDSGEELNLWHLYTATSTTRGTATAESPRISAGSEPWALVKHNNGYGTRPAQQGHRPPGKKCNCGVSTVFRAGRP